MTTQALLERVVVVSRHVAPVWGSEVDAVERDLGVVLPDGYRAFVTRFGEGVYCDLWRIYPPSRIRDELDQVRKAWAESFFEDQAGNRHWFFEGSEGILDPAALQESVALGDSINGDVLAFHSDRHDRIFILPRDTDVIEQVGADLTDLHRWPDGTPRTLTFQPFAGQGTADFRSTEFTLDLADFLARVRARWGDDGVLVTHTRRDERSWQVVLFVPAVGVRVQAIEDEGVSRSVGNATIAGSGERSLWISVQGDVEGLPEVRSLVDELASKGSVRVREG